MRLALEVRRALPNRAFRRARLSPSLTGHIKRQSFVRQQPEAALEGTAGGGGTFGDG